MNILFLRLVGPLTILYNSLRIRVSSTLDLEREMSSHDSEEKGQSPGVLVCNDFLISAIPSSSPPRSVNKRAGVGYCYEHAGFCSRFR